MSNNVTIDLKANPQGIKVGVGEASKEIDKFSKDSVKSFEKLSEEAEALEARLTDIKDKLAALSAANADITEKQTSFGIAVAKVGVEIAACAGLFGPLVAVVASAKQGFDLAKLSLESTGKTVEELNPNLDKLTQELVTASGGFTKFEEKANEAGVELEDFGIKVETNFERVKKAAANMLGKIGNGEYKKTLDDAKEYFGNWGSGTSSMVAKFASGVNKLANDITDDLESMAKAGGDSFAALRNAAARGLGSSGLIVSPDGKGGADESDIRANEGGQAARADREKQEANEAAVRKFQAESLAFEKEVAEAKNANKLAEVEAIELLGITSMKVVNDKLKHEREVRESLKLTNELNSEAGRKSYEQTAKLEGVAKAVSLEYRRQAEEARSVAKEAEDIADSFQKQKESIELNNSSVEDLKEKLVASNAEMAEAAKNQTKEDDARLERLQRIAALQHKSENLNQTDNDKKDTEAAIVAVRVEQEKADKAASDRIATNGDLRRRINQEHIEDIGIESKAIDARYSLEETRIGEVDRATITRLKAQGASDEELHNLRLDMLQEGAKRALAHADENKNHDQAAAERIQINGQLEKDVLRENAEFALNEDMKVFKAKERQSKVAEAYINSYQQDTLKHLQAQGASEKIIHEQKLKMLDAELERALENSKTEEGDLDLIAQHKIAKAKDVYDFHTNEEMKGYKLAEINRGVTETKNDATYRKKIAAMRLSGASDEKLHKAAMQHIDEEEKRETDKAKGDIERAAVKAQAAKARIQETTDYEISKEKEKHDKLKQLEDDVRKGKISYAEGLAKSGLKPKTRKEINEQLKQRVKDRKETVATDKQNKADKKNGPAAKIAKQEAQDKRKDKAVAQAKAVAKAKEDVEFRKAVRQHNADPRFKDRQVAVGKVKDKVFQNASAGENHSEKILNKVEGHLKSISDAAATTNAHEVQQLRALENVGKLT